MVALLELADTLANLRRDSQVQQGKHLALDDREVAFDLTQPNCIRRRMHAAAVGIGLLPTGRRRARMRRRPPSMIQKARSAVAYGLHCMARSIGCPQGTMLIVASMRPNTWSLPPSGAAR